MDALILVCDVEQAAARSLRAGFAPLRRGKINPRERSPVRRERGVEMVAMITDDVLGGLLSGLEMQGEMTALLEQLYYDGLS